MFDSFSSYGEGDIGNGVAHMVFDKMSPPKFDSFSSFEEGEIGNDVYFDSTSPPIFDEEPSEEREEEFITGYQIQRLGVVNKYSMLELNNSDRGTRHDAFQTTYSMGRKVSKLVNDSDSYVYVVSENIIKEMKFETKVHPPTSSLSSISKENEKLTYVDPTWASFEDKYNNASHRSKLEKLLGGSLLLGYAIDYYHKRLDLVNNYKGKNRGRVVSNKGRSSTTSEFILFLENLKTCDQVLCKEEFAYNHALE
ncbi:uncharacterized protein LOC113319233 [Papaver somniferum]|uniref:uncharacterized protein LOC113319233 n=1 Tax=Papaver somniferum TaxID=3469 RepID=UPI000E6F54F2|nr:uncharacterized protein LOC113319233 [Papaver somniferum]